MSKKITVNGHTIIVAEADVEQICELFKDDVHIDDPQGWLSNARTFIQFLVQFLISG